MVCLGLDTGVGESCAQTNPLSYGGTSNPNLMKVIFLLLRLADRILAKG